MTPRILFPANGFLLLLILLAPIRVGAEVTLNPDHPTRYVVQPGDTLWDIAGRFLQEPWHWGEIWDANPGIDNPNRIYPGDVLALSYRGGRPRLSVERGGMRTVKLTPRVRVEALDRAIPVIPAGVIAPFLTQPYVASREELDNAPYVVGFPDERLVAGLRDAIYARGIPPGASREFEIVRPGPAYRDPDTEEILGYEASFVADAALARPGDPAKLRINRSEIEVAIGDRLIPAADAEPLRHFTPAPAPDEIRGRIIAVLDGVTQIGQYDVVVINRGSRDGLVAGHVLGAYQGGDVRVDPVQARSDWRDWRSESPLNTEFWYGEHRVIGWRTDKPDANEPFPPHVEVRPPAGIFVAPFERSGILMVFRTFPRVSFALVMSAVRPMRVLDTVSAPDA